ncbi:MAG: TorF family putative porin [Alphaproteobacteria bacterium]
MTTKLPGRTARTAAIAATMAAGIAAAALAVGTTGSARADQSPIPGTFSANVSIGTDYTFRGISQTDENPTIQGGFDWEHESGIYIGTWASNVNFGDGDQAHIELDYYAGWRPTFGALTLDVGGIYYTYPGAKRRLDYDFFEAKLGASYDFDVVTAGASLNWSPNYFGGSNDAFYLMGELAVPLPHGFELGGHIGHQWIKDNGTFGVPDYLDWSVSISYALEGIADLKLSYTDTDLKKSECRKICDARAIFSVSRSF